MITRFKFLIIFILLSMILPLSTPVSASYNPSAGVGTSVENVFGKITAPSPIQPLVAKGGAGGISFILSRVVGLIYAVAALVFVFMVIFSAFQWITSGGEKEAVGKAQSRLTYALIGIVLLALTFVFANVVGQITGFTFFAGQKP